MNRAADHDPLAAFHPAVQGWFRRAFAAPTPAQTAAWPSIRAGRSTLVAAPTGGDDSQLTRGSTQPSVSAR